MVAVLACDHFVDALQQLQLQIYIKQVYPCDFQEVLARALEFEAFHRTTGSVLVDHLNQEVNILHPHLTIPRCYLHCCGAT